MYYEYFKICIVILLTTNSQTAVIMQNPKLASMKDGFLELRPNGTLILRNSVLNNASSAWQEAIVFKTILNAIHLMPIPTKNTLNNLNKKMYGEGVEHKFPPFLERVIQRIQTYFSVYRYTDTSEPLLDIKKPSSAASLTSPSSGMLNQTLTLGQNDIDVDLTSSTFIYNNNNNNTKLSMDEFKRPISTTAKPTVVSDEENEFVEIKKN